MLLNSILTISSKAMSRYPTGIAVTPPPAMRLHLPAMVHQLRFLIQHLITYRIFALASAARVTPYAFYIDARNNGGSSINSSTSRQCSDACIGAGLTLSS